MLERLPSRAAHAYLVGAFFVLPALGFVLTGGGRDPGPVATALLWVTVGNHAAFLVASTLLD